MTADTSNAKHWNAEIKDWLGKVAPFGCTVERSPHAYEIAKVAGPGVSLIIYPHKTGSNWHHARVRNNNSKDVELSRRVIAALNLWCKEDCHLYMYGYQGPKKRGAP